MQLDVQKTPKNRLKKGESKGAKTRRREGKTKEQNKRLKDEKRNGQAGGSGENPKGCGNKGNHPIKSNGYSSLTEKAMSIKSSRDKTTPKPWTRTVPIFENNLLYGRRSGMHIL